MRTIFKAKKHFDSYINLNNEDVEYYEEEIKLNNIKEDRIPPIKRKIFTIFLHNLIAKYSSGYEISELKNEFSDVITRFENGWSDNISSRNKMSLDDYNLILWILSIGVLLDVDTASYERIVKVLDGSGRKDFILDFVIASKIPARFISKELILPTYFSFLKELIETKGVVTLKQYLDKRWYGSMKPTYWYDNHKSKADTFFGYWSFESGAIVKILGLDDSILKDQQYYPYDLVHYKEV